MTGLASANIRLDQPSQQAPTDDIIVQVDTNDTEQVDTDDKGNIIRIEHPDGSVTISLDGRPLVEKEDKKDDNWFRNLADEMPATELAALSSDLLRLIDNDVSSRQDWIEDRTQGLRLLGLKIEIPGVQGSSDGAPVEGMSRVRHPLLLEAVLRFQANARSELLPTDGPVKIRNDTIENTDQEDSIADCLERDMNHYLTVTASEYVPDTDRMLLMLGFGGTAFKKVYYCPLRNRPVSETVDAEDLIVNNSATDLANSRRATHRTYLKPSTVRRLQILGVYRDIELPDAQAPRLDSAQQEKKEQQGISVQPSFGEQNDREIYECYCELDLEGYRHKDKSGEPTGLEVPYRVTIDVSSKEILSVVRNYNEPPEDKLPEPRQYFVKYTFVPGLGFYDIGLLHILGNTTNAVTAAWRELLDAGMYANFPGFLMSDAGGRQNTNIFRIPPGGGALVKTGGMKIGDAIMPVPYNTSNAGALMNLVSSMAETGQRVGGTAEAATGEGRADVPVGTILAQLEQAQKILNAVHKRMHAAQAQEFQLLKNCFKEHPESFWRDNKKPSRKWNPETIQKALDDNDLVPQADPNTASHLQRMMKYAALKQLQQANPDLYDPIRIDKDIITNGLRFSNPERFMAPPSAMGRPKPEQIKEIEELKIKKQDADTRTALAQAKIAETSMPEAQEQQDPTRLLELELQKQELALKMREIDDRIAERQFEMQQMELDLEGRRQSDHLQQAELAQRREDALIDAANRKRDRESRERVAVVGLAKDIIKTPGAKNAIRKVLPEDTLKHLNSEEDPIVPKEPIT
jgi:hypothetical protein